MNPNGSSTMTSTNATATSGYITISDRIDSLYYQLEGATQANGSVGISVKAGTGIAPELYFKYIKKKFGLLEGMKLDARLKRLEKAFNKAVENGQIALGEKFMRELSREARESAMYAKGIKHFIEMEDIRRYKNKIRGGHISDTRFQDFTRVIPDDVLAKKKKVEDLFDGFVIYHYWDAEAAKKAEAKEKMTPEEYSRMKDPVLFGVISESNRLYFIADWDDEYCNLSFEEIIDVVGGDDTSNTITREPKLNL
jgi:hypothetical protein